ncbi:MAG TPA: site-specific DNA-methyltransferase, partial [Telluria sp.]
IIERMLKASCPPGGVVLDPFMGSGTTALAAKRLGRHYAGFELNPAYCEIIQQRLAAPAPAKKRAPASRKKETPGFTDNERNTDSDLQASTQGTTI